MSGVLSWSAKKRLVARPRAGRAGFLALGAACERLRLRMRCEASGSRRGELGASRSPQFGVVVASSERRLTRGCSGRSAARTAAEPQGR